METVSNTPVESVPPSSNESYGFLNRFGSPKGFIVFILIVLFLAGAVAFSQKDGRNGGGGGGGGNGEDNPSVTPTVSDNPQSLSPHTIVYGNWRDGKSYIKAYDLSTQKEYILGILPSDIKKVTVLSSNKLLYIGGTDNKSDHGENISIYDIPSKESVIVYKADTNYGIDDYVISQNKKYISTWEVALNPLSQRVEGGKSRVYSFDISSLAAKNLIYDEQLVDATRPAHYPKAITNNKEIFLDTFVPNGGDGWAYGMSYSNFEGTIKKDIPEMINGRYGNPPSISPNEKYLVFPGYDKSDGTEIEGGYRKAVLKSNTVELLNTQTKEITKLENLPNTNTYSSAEWGNEGIEVILSAISKDASFRGKFSYNIANSSLKKIIIPNNNIFVLKISDNKILVGTKSLTVSATGNLGQSYIPSFETFSIYNIQDNNVVPVKITDPTMQFISLAPSKYFVNVTEEVTSSNRRLQLQTFNFKPSLEPIREEQQSTPPRQGSGPLCKGLAKSRCIAMGLLGEPLHSECVNTQMGELMQSGICLDSPLYLYGKPGTKVNIKVKTYVYNSDPSYSPEKGFDVLLKDNGKMEVNGKTYDRINYDYLSNKVTPPTNGIVTTKEELKETLKYLALNLGLNDKETTDLVNYGVNNIKSPFVFVSFFDDKSSKEILPITFNPTPDTYINIVFYFKEYNQKPEIESKPLEFKTPPLRNGLTAVEVSEIIDR